MNKKLPLLFAVLATAVSASAYDFEADGIYYDVISLQGQTCRVTYEDTDHDTYSGDIVIPSTVVHDGKTLSVTEIGEYAFDRCEKLTSVTMPASVTVIGRWAFYDCISLTSLTVPSSVTAIGAGAFSKCESLTSMEIPASVTEVGQGVLTECSSLLSITGKYASDDHRCLVIDGVLDSFAPAGLTEYTIPQAVVSIGGWAFLNQQGLTSLTLPSSVTAIGEGAFFGCSGLTSFVAENDSPSSIKLEKPVFDAELLLTCTLRVPQGSKELYASAPYWKEFATIEELCGTGIDNLDLDPDLQNIRFNLQGMRVDDSSKGIVIRNRKKIIIK